MSEIEKIEILNEFDVIAARMRVRDVARDMGFGIVDQARISVAASSLAHVLELNSRHPGMLTIEHVNHKGPSGIRVVCTRAGASEADLSQQEIVELGWLVDDLTIECLLSDGIRATAIQWLDTDTGVRRHLRKAL
jgi:serine/threonine-protein kinase RsbT